MFVSNNNPERCNMLNCGILRSISRISAHFLVMAITVCVSTAGLANAQVTTFSYLQADYNYRLPEPAPIEILDAVLLVPFFVVEETEIRGDTLFDIVVEDNRGRYVPMTVVVAIIGDGMYLVTVSDGMDHVILGISTDEDSALRGLNILELDFSASLCS